MPTIDLTQPLEPGMPIYPGDEAPTFAAVAKLSTHGYRAGRFTLTTHTGTHIDAPAHCLAHGKSLDRFPADHFTGPAMVLDCRDICGAIELSRLAPLDDAPDVEFVLILTGWDRFWGREEYFSGFPVLSEDAANFLATRRLKGIGVDAPSVDAPETPELTIHRRLLEREIVIVENLTRLAAIPNGRCQLHCLPLPITGADAAPARVIACCRSCGNAHT